MVVRRRDGAEHVKVLDFGLAKLRERATDPVAPSRQLRRPGDRDAVLHGARAGARRAARRARRSLQRRRDALPRADRRAAVRRAFADERARQAPHRRGRPPVRPRARAGAAARGRSDRAAGDGQGARRPLPVGDRDARGSGAGARPRSARARARRRSLRGPSSSPPPPPPGRSTRSRAAPTRRPFPSTTPTSSTAWQTGCGAPTSTSTSGGCGAAAGRSASSCRCWRLGRSVAGWRSGRGTAASAPTPSSASPTTRRATPTCCRWARRCGERSGSSAPTVRATSTTFASPPARASGRSTPASRGSPTSIWCWSSTTPQGRRVAKSDERGRGWGEWLQPTTIGPGESYLAVREFWIQGDKPTEDAPDPYTLTVRWGPPQAGWEVEPNDWPAAATPLPAPGRVRGYLGRADDQDWFALTVDHAGTLTGSVARRRASIWCCCATRRETADRQARSRRERGVRVWRRSRGAGADRDRAQAPARRRRQAQPLQGLDDPYELKVDLAP